MTDEGRHIVAVEDSDEDFFSLTAALKSAGVANPVTRCCDARSALATLRSGSLCPGIEGAALVFLDLNLPGLHGSDLLAEFRKNDQATPVLVFSTSSHPSDVELCYRTGANAYLVKPLDYDDWEKLFDSVARFWLHAAQLPEGGKRGAQ